MTAKNQTVPTTGPGTTENAAVNANIKNVTETIISIKTTVTVCARKKIAMETIFGLKNTVAVSVRSKTVWRAIAGMIKNANVNVYTLNALKTTISPKIIVPVCAISKIVCRKIMSGRIVYVTVNVRNKTVMVTMNGMTINVTAYAPNIWNVPLVTNSIGNIVVIY